LTVHDADFPIFGALSDTGVQLAGILIVQEECAPVGAGLRGADLHYLGEQLVESFDGDDCEFRIQRIAPGYCEARSLRFEWDLVAGSRGL
jgi:hypothetical protein